MEAEEIEEALENKNAERDAVPTTPTEDIESPSPRSLEDFMPRSG
jgi:hypothetical protein